MARAKKRTAKRRTTKPRPKTKRVTQRRPPPRAARTTPREARIDHVLIDRTLGLIAAHERASTESLREIGAAVIRDYFGGDLELAASNDPLKPKSFSKLVDRADEETTWNASDFRRAVKVELVARTLPSTLANQIPSTYLAHLGAVDDPAKRAELAREIASGTLRGTAVRDAISRASGPNPHGGRPRIPGPQKLITSIERSLERAEETGDLDAAEVRLVPPLAREVLAGRIRKAISRMRVLAEVLDDRS